MDNEVNYLTDMIEESPVTFTPAKLNPVMDLTQIVIDEKLQESLKKYTDKLTEVTLLDRINVFFSYFKYAKYIPVMLRLILFINNLKDLKMVDENIVQTDVKVGTEIAHTVLNLVGVTKKITDPTWALIEAAEDAIIAASYAIDKDLKA